MPGGLVPPPADPPDPQIIQMHHHHHSHKFLISTLAASVAAIAVLVVLLLLMAYVLYRRLCGIGPAPTAPADPSLPIRRFRYAQLRRATSSFSPSRKLGQGGFGPVFCGVLPSGQEVAVKLMDSFGSLQGDREFHNELSLAAKILPLLPDRSASSIVLPFGFCRDETTDTWWRRRRRRKGVEDDVADASDRQQQVMLVYDRMQNGSLQDALLDRRCPELLDWGRRFSVAVDIASGLQFLHTVCDPPVIHGDIKPGNILLDYNLSAKIADFGLARFRADPPEDFVPFLEDNTESEEKEASVVHVVDIDPKSPVEKRTKDLLAPWGEEDDTSEMGETAESTTTAGFEDTTSGVFHGIVAAVRSPEEQEEGAGKAAHEGDDLASPSMDVVSTSEANGGCDRMSVDSGRETGASSSRKGGCKKNTGMFSAKEWWWRQDNGAGGGTSETGGGVKDYVMEWIRSEIKERPKSDWITTTKKVTSEDCLPRVDRKKQQRKSEWWTTLDEERQNKKKNRPAREWWREEFCEELTKKKQKKRTTTTSESSTDGGDKRLWWENDENGELPLEKKKRRKKSWNRGSWGSKEWWMMDGLREIKTSGAGRRCSGDWKGVGEVPKSGGTISSTPSMRGTVCYVAPEYGGPLSEKCDIYSFGILLLVLISGRRPLQVMASPISKFERANLISWARHLARFGRLLDLVDPTLKAVDRDQGLLCITVALSCIQRSPVRRPSIKEIVRMLTGESEPPHLPMGFSPSPPGGFSFKSREKTR